MLLCKNYRRMCRNVLSADRHVNEQPSSAADIIIIFISLSLSVDGVSATSESALSNVASSTLPYRTRLLNDRLRITDELLAAEKVFKQPEFT